MKPYFAAAWPLILLPLALTAQSLSPRAVVPLKNWPAPQHVRRSRIQASSRGGATPQFQLPGSIASDALVFVPLTPCRLADTRAGSLYPALGSTPLGILTPVTLPITGSCGVPLINSQGAVAEAYSLNVTVVPPTGTPGGYLVAYPNPVTPIPLAASLTWNASAALQTGAVLVAASTDGSVNFAVRFPTDVVVDINGYYAPPTDANQNTGVGQGTLDADPSGNQNTALGALALFEDTTGAGNTAVGAAALQDNTTAFYNTAVGENALEMNGTGWWNTAVGSIAMVSNTSGTQNTAVGVGALGANTTGSSNVAVGYGAGLNITAGSNNLMVGNPGYSTDDHTIRIGDIETSAYMAGIWGATISNGASVVIDSNGQLGVQSPSSRRYKEDIQDMGDASDGLLRLRPVTFRYKKADPDGTKPLEFGLIAEEVADVYPGLVVRGAEGQLESVQYSKLPALLLNELQKQYRHAQQQDETIRNQQEQLRAQQAQNQKLEARLAALEAFVAQAASSRTAIAPAAKGTP